MKILTDYNLLSFWSSITSKREFHQSKSFSSLLNKLLEMTFEMKLSEQIHLASLPDWSKSSSGAQERLSRSSYGSFITVTGCTVISDFGSTTSLHSAEMQWNKSSIPFGWLNFIKCSPWNSLVSRWTLPGIHFPHRSCQHKCTPPVFPSQCCLQGCQPEGDSGAVA